MTIETANGVFHGKRNRGTLKVSTCIFAPINISVNIDKSSRFLVLFLSCTQCGRVITTHCYISIKRVRIRSATIADKLQLQSIGNFTRAIWFPPENRKIIIIKQREEKWVKHKLARKGRVCVVTNRNNRRHGFDVVPLTSRAPQMQTKKNQFWSIFFWNLDNVYKA